MTEEQKLGLLSQLSEQEKAGAFYREIKKDIPRLLTVTLCVAGQQMHEMNATSMDVFTEATLNGERYEIKAKFTLKKINL